MSPQSGQVLLQEIAPRLRSAIPQCVNKVGAEDDEELFQDGICLAAKLLDGLERRGKQVTPGNVAYYTILHLKSGRRSYSTGGSDVMGSVTQMRLNSTMLSFEEEVGWNDELGEPIRLEEMLADVHDDPSTEAARNMDWDEFLSSHDVRYACIVFDLGSGRSMLDTAKACGMTYNCVRELREELVEDLLEFFGEDAVADCLKAPVWHGNVVVDREKTACRADRRRS